MLMANDAQIMLELFFAIYFTLIIDRAHKEYDPYNTYSAWTGRSPAHRRLFASWLILVILPLLQFAVTYLIMGKYPVPLDAAPYGILNIVMIGFLSFFSFGYYRIFEAFLNGYPGYFYSDQELIERKAEARPEFWSHFMPGLLYILLTIIVLVLVVYF
jgi:hypothetical protein